jgi:predicted Zn-dependent protease
MSSTDLQARIERLRQRHDEQPGSKFFAPLADLLRQDGQVEQALVLLEDGLALYPQYVSAMVILGQTLLDAGRKDHARQVLARVLDLDPDNFVALGLLAQGACDDEDWETARPWLESLRRLEPDNQHWEDLWVDATVRPAPVVETESPPPPAAAAHAEFATLSMVDIYLAQGYLRKALAALRLIHSRDPGNQDVRNRLDEVLARLDEDSVGAGSSMALPKPDAGGPDTDHPAAEGKDSSVEGEPRHLEQARKRASRKRQFNDWINRLQDPDGRAP